MILPKFTKNCLKSRKFSAVGVGGGVALLTLMQIPGAARALQKGSDQ